MSQTIWLVTSNTQEEHVVCRAFLTKDEADAYASTAREWMARQKEAFRSFIPQWDYRTAMTANSGHRPELVDEAKAASPTWPFAPDPYNEFFAVEEIPVGFA